MTDEELDAMVVEYLLMFPDVAMARMKWWLYSSANRMPSADMTFPSAAPGEALWFDEASRRYSGWRNEKGAGHPTIALVLAMARQALPELAKELDRDTRRT